MQVKFWVKAQRQPNVEVPKAREADDKDSSSQVCTAPGLLLYGLVIISTAVLYIQNPLDQVSSSLCRATCRGTMQSRAWITRCSCS